MRDYLLDVSNTYRPHFHFSHFRINPWVDVDHLSSYINTTRIYLYLPRISLQYYAETHAAV